MPDVDALLETVERFAATLTGDYAIKDVLRTLTEQGAVVLGVRGVGVVLARRDRLTDVIAPVGAVADLERERLLGNRQIGPCADAMRGRQTVAVSDLTASDLAQRWPEYVTKADTAGIRAVAAVPMVAREAVLGVLGFYDGTRRTWTDEDLRFARIMADIASCYVVHASELSREREANQQLQHALTSRILIEQAKGVLAEARGVSVEEAFDVLRKHARDHNAGIHDVAGAVVNLHMRP